MPFSRDMWCHFISEKLKAQILYIGIFEHPSFFKVDEEE